MPNSINPTIIIRSAIKNPKIKTAILDSTKQNFYSTMEQKIY